MSSPANPTPITTAIPHMTGRTGGWGHEHEKHSNIAQGRKVNDRQDGTGRFHELQKKGGQGKANWGEVPHDQEEVTAIRAVERSLQAEAAQDGEGPDFVRGSDIEGEENALTVEEFEEQKNGSE